MKKGKSVLGKLKINKYILLSFLFPFLIMMIIFAFRKIYPFGDESFMHMDMYHQYVPFFSEFYHKLKSSESLFYSWDVGLGSNFLALFSYYIASPTNWFVALFPEKYILEFMTYLIVIKIAFCGVTCYLYMRYHFKAERYSMVLFSCFYALSGFIAAYNWDIMWLDNVILAPIIILGLEKLFYEKKVLTYTLALGLSILSDYYLSIMICIFVVLYFGVLLLKDPCKWKRIFPFAGCSLLAAGLAGVLLLPTYYALHFSEFGQFNFPKEVSAYFPLWDVVSRHFMNVATEQQLDHWPNIYCGVAVFLLMPVYVACKEIHWREKIGKLVLFVFFLASFSLNLLTFIWHGFNYPDSLPARQSFLYIFLVLMMCYEAFINLKNIQPKIIAGSFAGALIYLLLCEKLIGYSGDYGLDVFYLTGIFMAIYVGIFYGYSRGIFQGKQRITKVLLIFVTLVVLVESGVNMAVTSVSTTNRSAYLEDLDAYKNLVARTQERNPEFYRFEQWKRTTKNDGNLVGYPNASVFSSTANSYIGDLYEKLGMGYSKVFYCFDGATPLTSALLNVKYMFSESYLADNGGLYELADQVNGIYLYECKMSLPLGYIVDERLIMPEEKQDIKKVTPIDVQNNMVRSMLEGEELFTRAEVQKESKSVRVMVEEPGYYYAFSKSKKTKNMTVSVDGKEKKYKKMGNGYILPIGYVESSNQVILTCDENVDLDIAAYRMDVENLEKVIQLLNRQTLEVESYSADYVYGRIKVQEAGELVLTIPYEPGWTLKVDGEKVEANWYAKAFISTWLEEGEHTIELNYVPEGFGAGIVISVLSGIIVIVVWMLQKKRKNE